MDTEGRPDKSGMPVFNLIPSLEQVFTGQLPEAKQAEFAFLTGRLQETQAEFTTYKTYLARRATKLREGLTEKTAKVEEVENRIWQARKELAPNHDRDFTAGRLPVVVGRIRVRLASPNLRLPFPLRWMEKFALTEHPFLTPLLQGKDQTTKQLDIEQAQVAEQTELLNEEYKPILEQTQKDLAKAQRSLINFCDEQAATSLELARSYIQAMPTNAFKVVSLFVEGNASSENVLSLFPNFIGHIKGLVVDRQTRAQAQRRLGSWLESTQVLTAADYQALDLSVQRRWKEYVCYHVLLHWAKEGLIDKPELPNILQRP